MTLPEGWFQDGLERARREVAEWPADKQEAMQTSATKEAKVIRFVKTKYDGVKTLHVFSVPPEMGPGAGTWTIQMRPRQCPVFSSTCDVEAGSHLAYESLRELMVYVVKTADLITRLAPNVDALEYTIRHTGAGRAVERMVESRGYEVSLQGRKLRVRCHDAD